MANEQTKAALAPCGLSCEKCFAHVDGDIRRYSLKLKEKLGNFDIYAKRFETMLNEPIFKKYPDFKEMLDYFATENCKGCRNEQCRLFTNCGVRRCHQEKQIDFCYQCDAFPCSRTNRVLPAVCTRPCLMFLPSCRDAGRTNKTHFRMKV